MKVPLTLALLLFLTPQVYGEPRVCPETRTMKLLRQHQVKQEIKQITPLIKGSTYVDIWVSKESSTMVDCYMTEFTEQVDGLKAISRSVQHDGSSLSFTSKWTENNGKSSFNSYGVFTDPDVGTIVLDQYVHIFYANQFVFGYFSCDVKGGYVKLAIAQRKDKLDDKQALESLDEAETVMNELKHLVPDQLIKVASTKCPDKVK